MNIKHAFHKLKKDVQNLGHAPRVEHVEAIIHDIAKAKPAPAVQQAIADILKKTGESVACSACQIALQFALHKTLSALTEIIADAVLGGEVSAEALADAAVVAGEVGGDAAVDVALAATGVGAVGDVAAIPAEIVAEVVADEVALDAEAVIDIVTRKIIKSLLTSADKKIEQSQVVQSVIEHLCCLMHACPPAAEHTQPKNTARL